MSISQAVSTSLSPFINVHPMIFRVQCKRKKMEIGKKDGNAVTGFGGSGGGKMKEPVWQCVKDCGACCKLDKGPSFATPEEIFDNPVDVQLYRSLIGPDGWCVHFEKNSRTCSIYAGLIFVVSKEIYSKLCMALTRKSSIRRLAVSAMTPSKQFMGTGQKNWISLIEQSEMRILNSVHPCGIL